MDVATYGQGSDPVSVVGIRIRLRKQTVIWGDLMYPGVEDRVVEEVRFDLAQYLAEIKRGYARWGRST
ncbi:hypothetical protein ACFVTC_20605 [Streptomyces sp. NPDC057950]|uniref:hypothetical protein n=1 Tax=Streptomyces sp. NPDC057950 TaxID=3346288 RepID=UPI0036DFCBB6